MSIRMPSDESLRLQALEQYGLFSAPPDPALDEIVQLAAQICCAPLAGIALIGGDREVYRSLRGMGTGMETGIEIGEQPLGTTPCAAALFANGLVEIHDALEESEYAPAGIVLGGRSF